MTDIKQDISLLDYVEAVKDSANRSRFVLAVLAIASLLVFAATWNMRDNNFVYLRVGAATEAHKWCKATENWINDPARTLAEKGAYAKSKPWSTEYLSTLTEEDKTSYLDAEKYQPQADCEDLQARHDTLLHLMYEQTNIVRVPVVDLQFVGEDLGILGGLTLTIILIWLHLSAERELGNLVIAFDFATASSVLPACYELLSMRQLFTSPPPFSDYSVEKDDARGEERNVHHSPHTAARKKLSTISALWRGLRRVERAMWSKLLTLLPVCTYSCVLRGDWQAHPPLQRIASEMRIVKHTDVVFLVVISVLTIAAVVTDCRINRIWDKVAEKLHVHPMSLGKRRRN